MLARTRSKGLWRYSHLQHRFDLTWRRNPSTTHTAREPSRKCTAWWGPQAARQQDASQDEDALPQVRVDGCAGGVHTFIVEPFVPHQHEFYLCIQSERLGDIISFR